MTATQALLVIAGALYTFLGTAHGALTLRDLSSPQAFTPTDERVRDSMQATEVALNPGASVWRVWLGVHLTHSLGMLVFAGTLLALGLGQDEAFADHPLAAPARLAVAAIYVVVAARFFFIAPALVGAIGLACLAGAWVTA